MTTSVFENLKAAVLHSSGKYIIPLLVVFFQCSSPEQTAEADQFAMHIRTTEPQTPEEERLSLKLPEGFKITLFASEPDIGKPMNLSFDPKGRLWVTQSNEYPFYDSTGTGPDRISILEDTDHDGKADIIKVFADSLNIPIGITPVPDGAIAYSIPYVYHLVDHDGDDKVDERKILLSGFEYKDTHGMINNFFRGLDGWIHADHGYSNVSKVVGTDNKEPLVMQSGNTFRFHLDGTGVEFTTTGRVNPFGYAMDEYGYMYSVDCHSSPIYQLIRGADYPHFGKQPTGIGFGPYMMRHEYGSTALAGLEYYTGEQFPEAYRQNFYLGDVVKCRVYRSSIKMDGTTPVPTWEPDFIVSEDPWFRPVDVKLGPDGALYIADFYNSIIGHYEVPLDHPARDKRRGRIWRITYEGKEDQHVAKDWTQQDLSGLLAGLNDPSQTVRMMVADQIVDRFGEQADGEVKVMVSKNDVSDTELIHALWILYRLNALDDEILSKGLNAVSDEARVHTLRILFEISQPSPEILASAKSMIGDSSPHVVRAVTMLLAKYPTQDQVRMFLDLQANTPQSDSHLYYSIRQSLRDHLRSSSILASVSQKSWEEKDSKSIADVLMGVDNANAASFMLSHIQKFDEPEEVLLKYTTHIARFLPDRDMDRLAVTLRDKSNDNLDLQYQAFLALQKGVEQGGKKVVGESQKWAISLVETFLSNIPGADYWTATPTTKNYNANPWIYEEFEEVPDAKILISGPRRGRNTAVNEYRSPVFELPSNMSFTLVGYKEEPDGDEAVDPVRNKIELFLEGEDVPIKAAEITKEDQVEQVNWDLSAQAGKSGYILITDGSAGWGEYIGIGKLSAGIPSLPAQSPAQLTERQVFAGGVVANYNVRQLMPKLELLLRSKTADVLSRSAAAEAILMHTPENVSTVASVVRDFDESEFLRSRLVNVLGEAQTSQSIQVIASILDTLSFDLQKAAVLQMANNPNGIDALLSAAQNLDISPKLLLDPQINERLASNMSSGQTNIFADLTNNVTPFSEEVQELIVDRVRTYMTKSPSIAAGEAVFQQNCAICHQIGDQGGNIGPQLDGIGNWGLQALSEKILDPNRNISKAFVNYKIELKDGRIAQGLFRRDEGQTKVFADVSGNEFSYATNEIKSMNALPFTLMPDNFRSVIPEEDYYQLMGYLLSQN
ncbi:MAG: PVC-type heme-binding CxxCH protein [Bacteroidota bacterium]